MSDDIDQEQVIKEYFELKEQRLLQEKQLAEQEHYAGGS